jgi:hypothetical protein
MCSPERLLPRAVAILLCAAIAAAAAEPADLSSLQLPPQASPDEVFIYLKSIMKASPDPEGKSEPELPADDKSLQIGLIAQVGPENALLVFEAMHKSTSRRFSLYAEQALEKILDDSNKKDFLTAVISLPRLATLISKKNWQTDAKPVLLYQLNLASEAKAGLPKKWLSTLVLLKDAETNSEITRYFTSLGDGGQFFLPEMLVEAEESGFSLLPSGVAEDGWKHAAEVYTRQNSKTIVKAYYQRMAYAAAGRGNTEALQALAEGLGLDLPKEMIWWDKKDRLQRLQALTGASTEPGGFPAWIEARKEFLVFDQEKKLYCEAPKK